MHLHLVIVKVLGLSRCRVEMIQTNRVTVHQNLLATRSAWDGHCNGPCLHHLVKVAEHLLVFLRIVVNRGCTDTPSFYVGLQ